MGTNVLALGCLIATAMFSGYRYLANDPSDPVLFTSMDLPRVTDRCYCQMLALGVLKPTVPMVKTFEKNASGTQDYYCRTGFVEVNPEDIRERLVNFLTIETDEPVRTFHIPGITKPGSVLNETEIDAEMTPDMFCTLLYNPEFEVPVRNLAKKLPHYLVPPGVFRAFDIPTAILVMSLLWVFIWARWSSAEGASRADVSRAVGKCILFLFPVETACQFWFANWSLDNITVIWVLLAFLLLAAMHLKRPTIHTALFWAQAPDGQCRQEALTIIDNTEICGYLLLLALCYYCQKACWGTMFVLLLAHFGFVIFGTYGHMFLNLSRAWYNQEGQETRIPVSEVTIHAMKMAAVTFIKYGPVPPQIFGLLQRFNRVSNSDLVYERDALQLLIKATVAMAVCVAIGLAIFGMKLRSITSPRIGSAFMLTSVICIFVTIGFECMGENPVHDWPEYQLSAFEGLAWPSWSSLPFGSLFGYLLPR